MSDCSICGETLPLEEDQVKCLGCRKSYHFNCSGLSESTYRRMSNSKKDQWRCINCRQSRTPPVSTEKELNFDLKVAFEVLNNKFDSQMLVMNELKDDMKGLVGSLEALKVQVAENTNKLCEHDNSIKSLVTHFDVKNRVVDNLEYKINRMEQYSRRLNIEIHGLEEQIKDDDPENVMLILKKMADKMGLGFRQSDIAAAHRLPSKKAGAVKVIIVQFYEKVLRDRWLENRKKIKNNIDVGGVSDRVVFINENLTAYNKLLLMNAKSRAKERDYKYVWVRNGRIYVKKSDKSVTLKVDTKEDLNKIA